MSNYLCECETNDFGVNGSGTEYARLFSVKTNIKGSNHYNACQIVFQVLHLSSLNGVAKPHTFILTCARESGNDIINFYALDNWADTFKIGYKNVNGEITVYGKGWKSGARLKVQVIYCTVLNMFKFYNLENFTYSKGDLISASTFDYNYPIILQNGWINNTYIPSKCIKQDKYVTVNLCIHGGSLTEEDVICTLPAPTNDFRVLCVDNKKNAGYLELDKNGKLRPRLITTNEDVTCQFSYICK